MGLNRQAIGRDRRIVNAPWHWIKKQTARWRRRLWKTLGEDAPVKRGLYRGYVA